MERERRRIYDYFAAEDVRSEGKKIQWRQRILNEHSTKDKFDQIVEEGIITAEYELKALIISWARLSLAVPIIRFLLKTVKKLKPAEISPGVE